MEAAARVEDTVVEDMDLEGGTGGPGMVAVPALRAALPWP
jgi:hypothetical protein